MSGRGLARYNARRDANEPAIIDAFRKAGASVLKLAIKGAPDLVVFHQGRVLLVEVKTPKGALRKTQEKWRETWQGPAPVVVRTAEQAIEVLR